MEARNRLLRKSEDSGSAVQQPPVSRWIKPGPPDDDAGEDEKVADDEKRPSEETAVKSSSSAPPSCYSMAAVAAAVVATGSMQRGHRTTRSLSCRSTSQLSSYDIASALETINHIVMTKSMRQQKATRLIGPEDPPATQKRSDQVTVFVHVVFLKVGEIDTVKETYTADVFVQSRWREPLFDGQTNLKTSDIDWSKYWNPQLYVDNVVGEPRETVWNTVMFDPGLQAFVFEKRRIAGTFVENLELYQFPFDTQDITLTVVSERSVREVALEDDPGEVSTVNVQSFVDEQEWRLYSNVETRVEVVTRVYQGDDFSHPSLSTLCHASRRFGFYFWNILFVMFFISSMAFATFAVDFAKSENRLQLTFILLLTTITFKFAVNQSLPRISYLTYLDKYILSSMALLCSVCVWHAIVPLIHSRLVDLLVLATFGCVYLISHLAFYIFIDVVAIYRRNEFVEKERIHKARIKHLQVRPQDSASAPRSGRRQRSVGFFNLMERRVNRQASQVDV